VGSQGALRGPDSPPVTMQYVRILLNFKCSVTSLRSSAFV